MLPDDFHHTLNVSQHFIVPESQNLEPLRLYESVPDDIAYIAYIVSVLPPVYFNVQAGIQRHKIHNIWAKWKLTPEFDSCLLLPKVPP
jgi:hypothetical protein